jgi:hypothetical protein
MFDAEPIKPRHRSLAPKRMRQVLLSALIVIPFAIILLVWKFPDLWVFDVSEWYLFDAGFAIILVGFLLTYLNWRCPECNAYLGREFRPRNCRACGALFD